MKPRSARILVVVGLALMALPAVSEAQTPPAEALGTKVRVSFLQPRDLLVNEGVDDRRPTPFGGIRFSHASASGVSSAGTLPTPRDSALTEVLSRSDRRSMLRTSPIPAVPATQAAQKRRRPKLWAAVGAVVGLAGGVLYGLAGHPGLPHVNMGDEPDVLYGPIFMGVGAIVGGILGNR